MQAFQVTMFFINHDEVAEDEIKYLIENVRYPNRCLDPMVMEIKKVDIGEWSDDHPLNQTATMLTEYEKLFKR